MGNLSAHGSISALLKGMRTLGMRTLILSILALALLYIAFLTALSRSSDDLNPSLRGPPMVRQAAAAAELMDQLHPEDRALALKAINSPSLRFSLREDFSSTPPVETPSKVFLPAIRIFKSVLEERQFAIYQPTKDSSWPFNRTTLADELIIVMRLEDGSALVVENGEQYRRLVGFYGITFVGGFVSLVLIGLMIWASLSYAAPLGRLASASKNVVEAAEAQSEFEPLPETGPKPVRDLAIALNLAGVRLVKLTVERTTTLAAVAHDLRTYLTRLRMRSEFIEDDTQRDKTIRDIEDMAALIEDTLFLGKGVTQTPKMEPVELSGWLSRFVTEREEMGETVALGSTEKPATAQVSLPDLIRIMNNLVDNALRYAGTATLRLDTSEPDTISIDVLDDGPGVPDAFLQSMQDPFTRLEGSRSRDTGGTGLGLAITKALTERIGGQLILSNRESGGFCARVTLPRHL